MNLCLEISDAGHIASIHQEAVAVFPLAVYRDGSGAFPTRTAGRHTGLQAEQVQVAPAVERQLHNFLLFDDFTQLGVGGFDLERLCVHAHFLLGLADLQHHVNAALIVNRENDPGLDKGPEAGKCCLYFVSPDRKRQDAVLPRCVCCRFLGQIQVHVRRCHSNALNDG